MIPFSFHLSSNLMSLSKPLMIIPILTSLLARELGAIGLASYSMMGVYNEVARGVRKSFL